MAQTLTHLPHIQNVKSAREYYDPMYKAIFEVTFQFPKALEGIWNGEDAAILSEQVTKISGLDALQKTVGAGQQKFLGVDSSYLNPVIEQTYAEITIELNLNIRNVTDAFVLKMMKSWARLGYDLADGTRTLMADYVGQNLIINEANRDGTVWRCVTFHKVMLMEVTGLDDLDYSSSDIRTLSCKFRSDWWDEELG